MPPMDELKAKLDRRRQQAEDETLGIATPAPAGGAMFRETRGGAQHSTPGCVWDRYQMPAFEKTPTRDTDASVSRRLLQQQFTDLQKDRESQQEALDRCLAEWQQVSKDMQQHELGAAEVRQFLEQKLQEEQQDHQRRLEVLTCRLEEQQHEHDVFKCREMDWAKTRHHLEEQLQALQNDRDLKQRALDHQLEEEWQRTREDLRVRELDAANTRQHLEQKLQEEQQDRRRCVEALTCHLEEERKEREVLQRREMDSAKVRHNLEQQLRNLWKDRELQQRALDHHLEEEQEMTEVLQRHEADASNTRQFLEQELQEELKDRDQRLEVLTCRLEEQRKDHEALRRCETDSTEARCFLEQEIQGEREDRDQRWEALAFCLEEQRKEHEVLLRREMDSDDVRQFLEQQLQEEQVDRERQVEVLTYRLAEQQSEHKVLQYCETNSTNARGLLEQKLQEEEAGRERCLEDLARLLEEQQAEHNVFQRHEMDAAKARRRLERQLRDLKEDSTQQQEVLEQHCWEQERLRNGVVERIQADAAKGRRAEGGTSHAKSVPDDGQIDLQAKVWNEWARWQTARLQPWQKLVNAFLKRSWQERLHDLRTLRCRRVAAAVTAQIAVPLSPQTSSPEAMSPRFSEGASLELLVAQCSDIAGGSGISMSEKFMAFYTPEPTPRDAEAASPRFTGTSSACGSSSHHCGSDGQQESSMAQRESCLSHGIDSLHDSSTSCGFTPRGSASSSRGGSICGSRGMTPRGNVGSLQGGDALGSFQAGRGEPVGAVDRQHVGHASTPSPGSPCVAVSAHRRQAATQFPEEPSAEEEVKSSVLDQLSDSIKGSKEAWVPSIHAPVHVAVCHIPSALEEHGQMEPVMEQEVWTPEKRAPGKVFVPPLTAMPVFGGAASSQERRRSELRNSTNGSQSARAAADLRGRVWRNRSGRSTGSLSARSMDAAPAGSFHVLFQGQEATPIAEDSASSPGTPHTAGSTPRRFVAVPVVEELSPDRLRTPRRSTNVQRKWFDRARMSY